HEDDGCRGTTSLAASVRGRTRPLVARDDGRTRSVLLPRSLVSRRRCAPPQPAERGFFRGLPGDGRIDVGSSILAMNRERYPFPRALPVCGPRSPVWVALAVYAASRAAPVAASSTVTVKRRPSRSTTRMPCPSRTTTPVPAA